MVMVRFILTALLLTVLNCQPFPVWTDNCINVTSSGTCAQCNQGFYLEYFLCLPCAPLCMCSSQYNYCQSCISFTYKNSNFSRLSIYQPSALKCVLCDVLIPSCLTCSDAQTCITCYGGFYPISSTNGTVCSQNTCDSNCQICADRLTCQLCKNGSYLDPVVKICSSAPCKPNCLLCNSSQSCATCMPGYRYDSKRGCVPCVPNCLQCSKNELQCDICAPGYYPDLVAGCLNSSFTNCVLYYPNGLTATDCQVCQPGYFVLFGSCNPCVGCQLCSLQFLCYTPCVNATPFNYACLVPFIIFQAWLRMGILVATLLLLM